MFFLLLVVAVPTVLAFEAPTSILEGETLTITFDAGELHRDDSLIATTSPYEWPTTHADAGLYAFKHYLNGSLVETKSIEVIDVPLTFTIDAPDALEYTQNTIPVQLTTEASVDFCYYVLGAESNTLDATGNVHTGEITRPDGIYTVGSETIKIKAGDGVWIPVPVDLTPEDIEENPEIKVRAYYGERELALVKITEAEFAMKIGGGYGKYIVYVLIIAVILLILAIQFLLHYL